MSESMGLIGRMHRAYRLAAKTHAVRLLLVGDDLDQGLSLLQEVEDELHEMAREGVTESEAGRLID